VYVNNPAAGNYYIMLNGYTAYSGVTLKGTYAADTTAPLKQRSSGHGDLGRVRVAAVLEAGRPRRTGEGGLYHLRGDGDADLYVRRGARPTTATYDCRPYLTATNETCTITSPVAGTTS